jgi:CheY-like chemotaxis protein
MVPNPPKILLIEDDARAAVSPEELLKSEGYSVVVANRGDQGFESAQKEYLMLLRSFWTPPARGRSPTPVLRCQAVERQLSAPPSNGCKATRQKAARWLNVSRQTMRV